MIKRLPSKNRVSKPNRILLGKPKGRLKEEGVWGAGAPHPLIDAKAESKGSPVNGPSLLVKNMALVLVVTDLMRSAKDHSSPFGDWSERRLLTRTISRERNQISIPLDQLDWDRRIRSGTPKYVKQA